MAEPFISYAQNGEDLVIWRVFKDLDVPGCYVDVGAADPVGYSATYALYLRGWAGINIEPEPAFAEALRRLRSRDITIQVAAGRSHGACQFHVARGTGLSTAAGEDAAARLHFMGFDTETIEVDVWTLDEILEQTHPPGRPIHLLKIDVEGMEGDVLEGITLDRWKPWLCVVEATEPLSEAQNYSSWEHLLVDAGYSFQLFDGLNRYYLSGDHQELSGRLASGPNVFDQPFERAEASLALERHRSSTELHLEDARTELAHLEQKNGELAEQLNLAIRSEAEAQSEISVLGAQLGDMSAQLDEYRSSNSDLQTRLELERSRCESLATELEAERANAERMIEELVSTRHAAEQLEVVLHSKSWAVTRPLRWIRSRRPRR